MQQIKIPRMMRDVDWFTDTCTVAFGNIGKEITMRNAYPCLTAIVYPYKT